MPTCYIPQDPTSRGGRGSFFHLPPALTLDADDPRSDDVQPRVVASQPPDLAAQGVLQRHAVGLAAVAAGERGGGRGGRAEGLDDAPARIGYVGKEARTEVDIRWVGAVLNVSVSGRMDYGLRTTATGRAWADARS